MWGQSHDVREGVSDDQERACGGCKLAGHRIVFEKHDLPYSYDSFSKRYQSIIRNVSPDPKVDQAIVIHLYVDDEKRFTKEEVRDSFTAP